MKILIGDDNLDFARESMPYIPDCQTVYVATPGEVIARVQQEPFDVIITDLQYSENGEEGFVILEAIRGITARKILWTGAADHEDVRKRAAELGAEVLDKDELGALVGACVSKAPFKQGGKVLVYVSGKDNPVARAIKAVIDLLFVPGLVEVGHDLKESLLTNQYGLVIDTTTALPTRSKSKNGSVAHDLKYLKLSEVPRVVCVYDVCKIVADIAKLVGKFVAGQQTA